MRQVITHLRLVAPALVAAAIFVAIGRPSPGLSRVAMPDVPPAAAYVSLPAADLDPIDTLDPDALRDGDMAMLAGNTAVGAYVLSISGESAQYSHCGMIVRVGNGWAIVHAAPENAAAGDRGFTEAVPLAEFCARSSVRLLDVYRHVDDAAAARAALAARSFAVAAVPFDGAFDLATDDKLYCSELVWKCFRAAGATDPLHGRFDRGRGPFAPDQMILPHSLATSDQFRRVGVLVIDPLIVQHP